ncbi:MAG: hypothetical protein CVV37_06030 [Nitrospira bacterium HGW-Nitrospira-1]|nr:MAG: hypothetical protein CVV37_06030 [Nitrospira bacterium HGW-Nitrospira-1]
MFFSVRKIFIILVLQECVQNQNKAWYNIQTGFYHSLWNEPGTAEKWCPEQKSGLPTAEAGITYWRRFLEKKTCLDCFSLIRTQKNKVKCISPVGKLKKELPLNTLPRSFEVLAENCPGFNSED